LAFVASAALLLALMPADAPAIARAGCGSMRPDAAALLMRRCCLSPGAQAGEVEVRLELALVAR